MDEEEKRLIIKDILDFECHVYHEEYTGSLKKYYRRIGEVFERVVAEPAPNDTNVVAFADLVERRNNWQEAIELQTIWRNAVREQGILPRYFTREFKPFKTEPAWPMVSVDSPEFPTAFDNFKPREPGK